MVKPIYGWQRRNFQGTFLFWIVEFVREMDQF